MSGFSQEEKQALLEPIAGLNVDPTKEDISMTGVSTGAAGGKRDENIDLSAEYQEFGQKMVDRAYARGWRPKSEHQGNPDNWLDPIDFFDRYAETSDKRAEKAADRKLTAITKTVEKRMADIAKRVDRIDETDRAATEEYYAGLIARAGGKDIPKLLKDRDTALAEIDKAKSTGTIDAAATGGNAGDDIAPETIAFFERFPHLANPSSADAVSHRSWAAARAAELETKYPNANAAQIYNQLGAELEKKMEPTPTTKGGRNLTEGGGSGGARPMSEKKLTAGDLTQEEKSAFRSLVSVGAYKEGELEKYVADLAVTKSEEAMANGAR